MTIVGNEIVNSSISGAKDQKQNLNFHILMCILINSLKYLSIFVTFVVKFCVVAV